MPFNTNSPNDASLLQILEYSKDATAIYTSADLTIGFVNDAMLQIWDKTRAVKGKTFQEALPEMAGQPFADLLKTVWKTGETYNARDTSAIIEINGTLRESYFDFEYKAIKDISGQVMAILHTATDVSARFKAEQLAKQNKLQEQQVRDTLELALDAAKFGTWHIHTKTRDLVANNRLKELFGFYPTDTVTVASCIAQITDDFREEVSAGIEKAITEGSDYDLSYTVKGFHDQQIRWLRAIGNLRVDASGEFSVFTGVLMDISEQVVSRQAIESLNSELRQARDRFYSFIVQAPAALTLLRGPQLIYNIVNPKYQEIVPGRNLEGRSIFEALPELVGTPVETNLNKVFNEGVSYNITESLIPIAEYEFGPTRDRYFNYSFEPWYDDDGKIDGVMNLAYEVTEQVLTRNEVVKLTEDLQLAINAANLGTWTADLATDVLDISARSEEIHGLAPGEVFTLSAAMQLIIPEHRERMAKAIENAIVNRTSFTTEYIIQPKDGSAQKWLLATGKATYASDGTPLLIGGTAQDVTEAKKNEQLKNDFIGMVSHELKTPLTSLSGSLQILSRQLTKEGNTTSLKFVDTAYKQVNKMTKMIQGFLDVSRLESGKIHIDRQDFDLKGLLDEIQQELLLTTQSHQLVFEPIHSILVNADKDKIGQVLINYIGNAVKYSAAGTTISVSCTFKGGSAEVCVRDEGKGISAKDITHVFDRYYRADDQQMKTVAGFGIGLYLSKEIIEHHNGKVWAESEVGRGAKFYFTIPLARL